MNDDIIICIFFTVFTILVFLVGLTCFLTPTSKVPPLPKNNFKCGNGKNSCTKSNMNVLIPLLTYYDIIERLRNYAGQQELFRHSNERVSKELKELADTIESGQHYMKGRIE